jgi:hypothetical protein
MSKYYLNPAYRHTTRSSYPIGNFTNNYYIALYNLCINIKGKFLLSINDDFIRLSFSGFNIISI